MKEKCKINLTMDFFLITEKKYKMFRCAASKHNKLLDTVRAYFEKTNSKTRTKNKFFLPQQVKNQKIYFL
jgi:hypothetical protein